MNNVHSPLTLVKRAASIEQIPISLTGAVPSARFMARSRASQVTALLAVVGLCGLMSMLTESAESVTFTVFTDPHPVVSGGTIGFAYAGNKFVGSVEGDGPNLLYSTDLNGGSVALFAPSVSLDASPAGEHFVASSLGLGGFPSRDIYVAEGTGIRHITNDGTSDDVFVSGLASNVRGILFDAIGTFGHDMLVTTDAGHVYRIDSGGVATLLATIGPDTEGLDIAPLGAGFGSFDGQLIVASEGTGELRAITPGGTVTLLPVIIPNGPEELTFVPLNLGASGNPVEGFYGADFTQDVIKAPATEFSGFQGDIIVTSEIGDHRVTRVHWNGSAFETDVIGNFPNQPEDGIFVTAAIIRPGGAKISCDVQFTDTTSVPIPSDPCGGAGAGVPVGTTVQVSVNICADATNAGSVNNISFDLTLDGAFFDHCLSASAAAPGECELPCSFAFTCDSPGVHTFVATVVGSDTASTSCSKSIECCTPSDKCPFSQGYWKNHPHAWPLSSVTLGAQSYSKAELLTILGTSTTKDASLILARQLIAAFVNTANGSDPRPVCNAITQSNNLLSGFRGKLPYNVAASSTTGQAMVGLARALDNYNNALLTPGCTP